ncbi:MAG: FtsX-like permease family protein [bacterium]
MKKSSFNVSSFLAWRYLRFKSKDANISFMIKICFLGILIGTFALMFTLIITNGFEKTIHEKMQGINSHILISAPAGDQLNYSDIRTALEQDFPDIITGISCSSVRQTILEKHRSHNVILLKGVDEQNEHLVTNIHEKIIQPKISDKKILQKLLHENHIIIGYKTAETYDFRIGDEIDLLIPEQGGGRKIALRQKKVIIAGIFKIGLEEYDSNFAFASHDFLNQTFEEKGVDQVTIKIREDDKRTFVELWQDTGRLLSPNFVWKAIKLLGAKLINIFSFNTTEQQILNKLKTRLPELTVQSWKDLYPALVSSLKLEKYVMFFILALITLVAAMNMVSLLFMQIQQKQGDIAILKAMGTHDNIIRAIFLRLGLTITFWASLVGLGLAAGAGYLLENYPFIQLPDVYYVSYLPARMDIEIFLIVFAATMIIGFLATWIPARRSKGIDIAHVLRQE